ncbi:MAG: Holliday junction branch migration DNA helicase RuvB [Spirochaetales bacterium]|uniref:Holliday junction branch migration complex subunit RuvB n=1 Tax=Candidatus Thalassospirochaeta sargassi TaxID=3119039 RepID=A0AAJ1IEN6_9SPIO|nr:Holliday junction branch migration DNA helicase RuvB [Spirochaetales bacterium]
MNSDFTDDNGIENNLLNGDYNQIKDGTENPLRPKKLADFQGQDAIKSNLSIFIQAANDRSESLDHVFLSGPPGLGKTTLAGIIANELGAELKVTSAPAIEKPKDLAGILTGITERCVFFIDEIHRLKPAIEEMLYIAMEDYEMDWVIGQGPSARNIRIPIPQFTLIGATTKAGAVASPLYSRFGISCRMDFYRAEDIMSIIRRSAGILDISIDEDAVVQLAGCSRGTPRVANRLLRRMRDFAHVENSGIITKDIVMNGLKRLEIDAMGLERLDRQILRLIIERYDGGPVGAETLAISAGEAVESLEDFYEPYMIQQGFIKRTPRGRMVTDLAYSHLGLTPGAQRKAGGNTDENQSLLF